MELQDLRCFMAVAQQLNFTRAAEELHVTQPTLSRRIRDLENIRVNAILPGMTATPMILAFKDHFPDMYDQMERQIPLGRLATPEEQANTALFLCSDLSSDITGELIKVDGGYLAGRYEKA